MSAHLLRHVDEYLAIAQEAGASDVHLGVNAPPVWRLHGTLQPIWPDAPRFKAEQTQKLADTFLNDVQRVLVKERGDADFAYANSRGRYRASVARQRLGTDIVFRIINTRVRTMDELGLPEHLKLLTRYHNGLILVTGSVGSGKSTTLAALVEQINIERREHIITLEDPIEYVLEPKGCHITQREVHTHTLSFGVALRGALREDPDVIMVGEMRDLETISLAITAAETGHLVFGTLHTNSAIKTIDRVIDVFPEGQQTQIRVMLSESLRGVVAQALLPRPDRQGRVPVVEILVNLPSVANLIREGKSHQIANVMQTGRSHGMVTFESSIHDLIHKGLISKEDGASFLRRRSGGKVAATGTHGMRLAEPANSEPVRPLTSR